MGTGHSRGLRHADTGGVRRGGQAGVVEHGWNDEGLKALSARVVRAAPNERESSLMQAVVLGGLTGGSWEAGPRAAAEFMEAATHFEQAAALQPAPSGVESQLRRCRGLVPQPSGILDE